MFGLAVFVVGVIYLIVLLAVTISAYSWAARRGLSRAKRWWVAAGGFLVIYLPVFWDHVPTVVAHQYYCAKEAGFWEYKTVEQWKKENPKLILTQGGASSTQKEESGYNEIHQINQRINWIIKLRGISDVLPVSKREEILVDTLNNSVLAKFTDFSRGNQSSTGTMKFWLVGNDCNGDEKHRVHMGKLIDEFYAAGKGDQK